MEFTTTTAGRARRSGPVRVAALVGGAAALAALALGIGVPDGVAGATTSHAHAKVTTIHVSTATVEKVGTVLTTSSGLTLYRYTSDPMGQSLCTGACAKIWPPLTAAKDDRIAGPKGVKGLSVIDVGQGRWQVAFHDVALYRFEGDTKKGQAKGQGVAGTWFAVLKSGILAARPSATAGTAATTPTTAPASSTNQPVAPTTTTAPATQSQTKITSSPVTTPPAATPPTSPPTTQPPPTTTPPTQPQTTTPTTSAGGGYGY